MVSFHEWMLNSRSPLILAVLALKQIVLVLVLGSIGFVLLLESTWQ